MKPLRRSSNKKDKSAPNKAGGFFFFPQINLISLHCVSIISGWARTRHPFKWLTGASGPALSTSYLLSSIFSWRRMFPLYWYITLSLFRWLSHVTYAPLATFCLASSWASYLSYRTLQAFTEVQSASLLWCHLSSFLLKILKSHLYLWTTSLASDLIFLLPAGYFMLALHSTWLILSSSPAATS